MNKITFVLPSRNNLEFLQLAYKSIRDLETKHEVLVLDDASTDGTQEWIKSLNDDDLITYHNPGPERIGIVGMFDKGIEMARTEIIFAFHADMVACKDLDENILKYLKPSFTGLTNSSLTSSDKGTELSLVFNKSSISSATLSNERGINTSLIALLGPGLNLFLQNLYHL